MAYNPYLTNPYTGQQYFVPPMQQPVQPPTQPAVQPQIQNSGLVGVRSIDEVLSYPVAPGISVTFKDETAPYIYTKSMGVSQLDRPIVEKYRLVKEEAAQELKTEQTDKYSNYVTKSEYEALRADVDDIKKDMESIRTQTAPKRRTKKEAEDDDE